MARTGHAQRSHWIELSPKATEGSVAGSVTRETAVSCSPARLITCSRRRRLPRMKRQVRRDPRRGRQDGFGPDGRERLVADESVDAE
jgi:hypothetical protein